MFSKRKDDFVGNAQRKCVHVHANGDFENGKVLYMEPDWMFIDFLNAASNRLNLVPSAKRAFNADGAEIDDCMMIEDDDILFLSIVEDFIAPSNLLSNDVTEVSNMGKDDKIPPFINGYKVGELLGRGGFGEVRVGEHQVTQEKVALKFLRKSEIHSLGAAERTNTEIQCLQALKHMNCIKLHMHLETPNHIVLIFELMEGGDLMKYLVKRKASHPNGKAALTEEESKHVFYQVISAVSYAHNQHICHRDLKLENILLKDNTIAVVKIADFGLSDFYRPGAMMKSNCGTLSFLAPEVFKGTMNAGPPLDVWSLGVILFAMLCGRLPFEGNELGGSKRPRDAVIKSKILKCQYKIDENIGPEAKDLIRRMLHVDPAERASIPEIFNHVWLRSNSNSHLIDSFQLQNMGSSSSKLNTFNNNSGNNGSNNGNNGNNNGGSNSETPVNIGSEYNSPIPTSKHKRGNSAVEGDGVMNQLKNLNLNLELVNNNNNNNILASSSVPNTASTNNNSSMNPPSSARSNSLNSNPEKLLYSPSNTNNMNNPNTTNIFAVTPNSNARIIMGNNNNNVEISPRLLRSPYYDMNSNSTSNNNAAGSGYNVIPQQQGSDETKGQTINATNTNTNNNSNNNNEINATFSPSAVALNTFKLVPLRRSNSGANKNNDADDLIATSPIPNLRYTADPPVINNGGNNSNGNNNSSNNNQARPNTVQTSGGTNSSNSGGGGLRRSLGSDSYNELGVAGQRTSNNYTKNLHQYNNNNDNDDDVNTVLSNSMSTGGEKDYHQASKRHHNTTHGHSHGHGHHGGANRRSMDKTNNNNNNYNNGNIPNGIAAEKGGSSNNGGGYKPELKRSGGSNNNLDGSAIPPSMPVSTGIMSRRNHDEQPRYTSPNIFSNATNANSSNSNNPNHGLHGFGSSPVMNGSTNTNSNNASGSRPRAKSSNPTISTSTNRDYKY